MHTNSFSPITYHPSRNNERPKTTARRSHDLREVINAFTDGKSPERDQVDTTPGTRAIYLAYNGSDRDQNLLPPPATLAQLFWSRTKRHEGAGSRPSFHASQLTKVQRASPVFNVNIIAYNFFPHFLL